MTKPQTARVWVNFNGTGTVAKRDSFNVLAIDDNGTGDYTVNIDVDMSSANYSANIHGDNLSSIFTVTTLKAIAAGSIRFQTSNGAGSATDTAYCFCQVFGDAD